MADIVYTLEGDVYLNITNKCPCNCAFCIRSKGDAYGDAKELWFDKEPTFEEIKRQLMIMIFIISTKLFFAVTVSLPTLMII